MNSWRALVLAVVVGGCSGGTTAPMDLGAPAADLSAASDMTTGCTLTYSGDASATIGCRVFLCHPTGTVEYLNLTGPIDNPTETGAHFLVDGAYAVRSYTAAQLNSFDAGVLLHGKRYVLQPSFPDPMVSVTIDSVTEPPADPCSGSAHGTVQATLFEQVSDDAGAAAPGPGRLIMNARF